MIDTKWFKDQQKRRGVTNEAIAERMGRTRTTVSHIYGGTQRMSLEWAKVFAEMLDQPLGEVLRRAGVADSRTVQEIQPGFAESSAAPWTPPPGQGAQINAMAAALGQRPGLDIWRVRDASMALAGLLPGDFMLVDTHAATRARAGDTVLAQVYDHARGTATTLLRRYEPPVLVAASTDPADGRVHVVDGNNVLVRGIVTASWRLAGANGI